MHAGPGTGKAAVLGIRRRMIAYRGTVIRKPSSVTANALYPNFDGSYMATYNYHTQSTLSTHMHTVIKSATELLNWFTLLHANHTLF